MKTCYLLIGALVLSAAPAYAGIGGIGSPVQPSNGPLMTNGATPYGYQKGTMGQKKEEQPAGQTAPVRKPLMVIRFNRNHVYFDRALKQAVAATERVKPGALYEVESHVPVITGRPASPLQGEHISQNAADNLNAVTASLQELGVPPNQIQATTESDKGVSIQEIRIFVK